MEVQAQENIVATMAATGANMAKPPTLNPDRRAFGLSICQYIANTAVLRERLTNIQDQYLQSLKSIFLETLSDRGIPMLRSLVGSLRGAFF